MSFFWVPEGSREPERCVIGTTWSLQRVSRVCRRFQGSLGAPRDFRGVLGGLRRISSCSKRFEVSEAFQWISRGLMRFWGPRMYLWRFKAGTRPIQSIERSSRTLISTQNTTITYTLQDKHGGLGVSTIQQNYNKERTEREKYPLHQ